MEDRIIPLEGVRNFRDFGGYPTADGRRVKKGLLFRSGHHAEATDRDIEVMDTLRISFQADLRRPDERERQQTRWPQKDAGVEVLVHDGGRETTAPHMQFLQAIEVTPGDAETWMHDYYRTAPFREHHVALFRGWFDRLAGLGAHEAALVNCAAGKDRTGIVCALTKHVLGVPDSEIVADYELTNTAVDLEARLPEAQRYFNDMLGKEYPSDVYKPFMGVDGAFLRTALKAIEDEAGSLDIYLEEQLGVDAALRAQLVARLVD